MATYTTNLVIELIGTGELAGTWGTTTNQNFQYVFEEAIVGRAGVAFSDANVTLTTTQATTDQTFRNVYLNCTGTNTAQRSLIVPTINKNYIVENNTTGGFAILVTTSGGTGLVVPNGYKAALYVDGTNVVTAFNYFGATTFSSITDSGLTSGRVTYAGTGGLLQDSANLTFNGTTLTANTLNLTNALGTAYGGTGLTSFTANQVFYASSTSAFAQSSNLQFSGADLTVYGITVGRGAGSVSTNTAVGASALAANTSGASNTSLGYQALQSNTTASNNTAVGYQAGYTNSVGTGNVYLGQQAGYTATGNNNVMVGYYTGYGLTTGVANTFIGQGSGYLVTTGSKNSIIGGYSGNQGGLDIRTASNYIVLSDGDGNPTLVSTGAGSISANNPTLGLNSELCLMRASVKRYFIWNDGTTNNLNVTPASFSSGVTLGPTATAWSAYSDRRIKSNIVDIEYGLSTIMAMQPRRYTVTANGVNSIGFIAQELKTVLPEAVVGEEIPFDDADTPQERSSKTMGIAKDHIIPVLVKAIQELKAEVDSLKAQINGASA